MFNETVTHLAAVEVLCPCLQDEKGVVMVVDVENSRESYGERLAKAVELLGGCGCVAVLNCLNACVVSGLSRGQ